MSRKIPDRGRTRVGSRIHQMTSESSTGRDGSRADRIVGSH